MELIFEFNMRGAHLVLSGNSDFQPYLTLNSVHITERIRTYGTPVRADVYLKTANQSGWNMSEI